MILINTIELYHPGLVQTLIEKIEFYHLFPLVHLLIINNKINLLYKMIKKYNLNLFYVDW